MARNVIVVNVDLRETRIALIEGGVVAELHIERQAHRSTVGNIVLGKVTRVLPGMQAAFIDVGQERAAFLHVEDLIRPDDFDAYLSGETDDESGKSTGTTRPDVDADGPSTPTSEVPSRPSAKAAGGATSYGRQRAGSPRRTETSPDEPDASQVEASEPDAPAASDPETVDDDSAPNFDVADLNSDPGIPGLLAAEIDSDIETTIPDDDDDDAPDDDADDADGDVPDDDDDVPDDDDDDDDADGDVPDDDDDDDDADGDVPDDDDDDADDDDAADGSALDDDDSGDDDNDVADDDDDEPEPDEDRDSDDSDEDDERDSADEVDTTVGEVAPNLQGASTDGTAIEPSAPTSDGASDSRHTARAADDGAERPRGRSRRRRRGRRRGSEAEAPEKAPAPVGGEARRAARRGRGGKGRPATPTAVSGKDNGRRVPARVSRSVPISEVVKEGDQVVVQISKEPIGTKGARVTSHVSLPGRYVVYLPTVEHVGISKRIGSSRERGRLRTVIDSLKPKNGGLIVRTVAEGLTKKQLKADVGYLIKVWTDVAQRRENAKAPDVLYEELDLVLKVARDFFTDDVDLLVIDDKDQYARLVRFVEMFMPQRVKDIKLYTGEEPVFDAYGIEDEIRRALSRKVPLPSGGSLIMDQAEALTAIDVNTGRFVGKGSKDLEETALKTNLEAVDEIAYQLRFRNIGGLVILDLIDMERAQNRDKVWRALEQRLARDKAKTTINRISELGLIEMTRKRTRESLGRTMHEPCFYCDGTGHIQSRETIAYEIMRQIRRDRHILPGYSIHIHAHPAVVDFLKFEAKDAVREAERRYQRRIDLHPRTEFHIEQYDLQGK